MTSLDFSKFKHAIDRQFDKMAKRDLFRTDVNKDQLWDKYLSSFPAGTNNIYRERSEYDCSCCRQFVKAVGNTVTIIDGKVVSIWDIEVDEPAYQAVADSMSQFVKAHKVTDVFLHPEKSAGTDKNFEDDNGKVITWNHFHVDIPWGRNQGKNYYRVKKEIPTELGLKRADHDVFLRGLTELTQDSVDTVLDIIRQNSLYRGNEYRGNVKAFGTLKGAFDKLKTDQERDLFVWENFDKHPGSVTHIRNTAIGTLLIDLSAGEDLEGAVRKFETSIMAPSSYQRPTALVSQKMVDSAKKTVEELGLTSALERRYAKLADVSVNDIIFANREARGVMVGGAFDGIANKATTPKNLDKVETVSIEKFIKDIVPQVDSIEVFVDNRYINNLVSLVAPAYKNAKSLFKWNNDFSWSYNGDFTDSIKERVKKAGGNVTGDLACRLAWSNYDDLDFHMKEAGGFEIAYYNKVSPFTGGQLDVDMNAGGGRTREPVENIFYSDIQWMREGNYELFVHQFMKRENTDVGFEAEIDYFGGVKRYAYGKPLSQGEKVVVAKFKYTHVGGIEITESLPESNASKTVWGIRTQDFHKVNVFMLSPNHWEGEAVGNKHYFFMLENCINDGQARGFFNEFLKPDLDKHRKVLEIVGSKMKTGEAADQLSGLGFSDTKRAEVIVRVKGSFTRLLKVTI